MRGALHFDTVEALQAWANRKRQPPRVLSPSAYRALEDQEHFALVKWRDLMSGQVPELRWLFHCPNGEFRTKGTAVKLAKMGVLRGVSDFLWLYPKGRYHGLCLELKARGGIPTPDQLTFLQWAKKQGYYADWCQGWQRASDILTDYNRGNI